MVLVLKSGHLLFSEAVYIYIYIAYQLLNLDSNTFSRYSIFLTNHVSYFSSPISNSASVVEESFLHLDAPVERIAGADVPMPYAANLERLALPQVNHS